MKMKLACVLASSLFMFGGLAEAAVPPWVQHVIVYDGYLQQTVDPAGGRTIVTADTLFVVNNPSPFGPVRMWMEVMTKKGELVWEGILWDGGKPVTNVVAQGFGWITLGMVVTRSTESPFGQPGMGEKFQVRISVDNPPPPVLLTFVPTVEIKQVVYQQPATQPAKEAIWNAALFRTWAEAALGGNKNATGVAFSTNP